MIKQLIGSILALSIASCSIVDSFNGEVDDSLPEIYLGQWEGVVARQSPSPDRWTIVIELSSREIDSIVGDIHHYMLRWLEICSGVLTLVEVTDEYITLKESIREGACILGSEVQLSLSKGILELSYNHPDYGDGFVRGSLSRSRRRTVWFHFQRFLERLDGEYYQP